MDKILFIRRDNIGDLVCTTPAIRAVRRRFPDSRIAVLVNSYNAGALAGNTDVNEIYVYEKGKHAVGKSGLRVFLDNLGVLRRIRKERFDVAVGCGYGYSARVARLAWLTGAKQRVGFVSSEKSLPRFFYNVGIPEPDGPIHEVEAMMRLVAPLGVDVSAPRLSVTPDKAEVEKVLSALKAQGYDGKGLIVFHISSRKPVNRWPKEFFRELGDMLQAESKARILLLWSPGSSANVLHPGDDESADWIASSMKARPYTYMTRSLAELIAAMSLAATVVCCDGGAMHIAAGLGKPMVAIWGATQKKRWAPWGVPNAILQKDDGRAASITAREAFEAFMKLVKDRGDAG